MFNVSCRRHRSCASYWWCTACPHGGVSLRACATAVAIKWTELKSLSALVAGSNPWGRMSLRIISASRCLSSLCFWGVQPIPACDTPTTRSNRPTQHTPPNAHLSRTPLPGPRPGLRRGRLRRGPRGSVDSAAATVSVVLVQFGSRSSG